MPRHQSIDGVLDCIICDRRLQLADNTAEPVRQDPTFSGITGAVFLQLTSLRGNVGREVLEIGVTKDIAKRQLSTELAVYEDNEFPGQQGIPAGRKEVCPLGNLVSSQDVSPNRPQSAIEFRC